MGFLPSCSHVSTTVWLYHLNFNETPEEKARWELHKALACYFEPILEVTPFKTAAVQLFTTHLINHVEHCWRNHDKQCSPKRFIHRDTLVLANRQKKNGAGTGCHPEGLLRMMANRSRWQKRVNGIFAISIPWWWRSSIFTFYNVFTIWFEKRYEKVQKSFVR